MTSRNIIYGSAVIWCGAALYYEATTVAAVALFGHMAMLSIHNIEIKINKLLDRQGIIITDRDLAD